MTAGQTAEKLKIFISYSRRDSVAADALVEALLLRSFEVTIDRRDLPFGEKWQSELAEFIRLSDTVVWLVSDASIQSKWVNWELDEVARRNKRLVPVMIAATERDALPRQLGEIHILPAEGVFAPSRDLEDLIRVLETDRAWLKEASRLQDRAHEWLGKSRTSALLLSRGAMTDAERWKDRRPAKAPAPAQEVLELVLASRQAAKRQQRWWFGGSLGVILGSLALAGYAVIQNIEAGRQGLEAEDQRRHAIKQAALAEERRRETAAIREQNQITEASVLARSADDAFDPKLINDPAAAMLLSLEALPDEEAAVKRPYVRAAEVQLDGAMRANLEILASRACDEALDAFAISPDQQIFGMACGGSAGQWVILRKVGETEPIVSINAHSGRVDDITFSPDGRMFATASYKEAKIWDLSNLNVPLLLLGHEGFVRSISFSPDGKKVATASWDETLRVWDTNNGTEIRRFSYNKDWIYSTSFSPDGSKIVGAAGRVAVVWDASSGEMLAELKGHRAAINFVGFSPDGRRIVTASDDQTARIWDAKIGSTLEEFVGHTSALLFAGFTQDGERLVTSSTDGTARLWNTKDRKLLQVLGGHEAGVRRAEFVSGNTRLLTATTRGTIRLWKHETKAPDVLPFRGTMAKVHPSDGRLVVGLDSFGIRLPDVSSG